MFQRAIALLFLAIASAGPVCACEAPNSESDSINVANNPLTPSVTINLQDYFVPATSGVAGTANQFLLRGLVPQNIGGLPQLMRFTVPIATAPPFPTGSETAAAKIWMRFMSR